MELVVSDFQPVSAKEGNTRAGILTNQNTEADELIKFDPQTMDEFVDELSKPRQVNFVKYRVYENPELDAEIDRTEQEIQAMDATCVRIARSIKEKKLVLPSLRWQLACQNEAYEKFMNEKNMCKIVDQQKSLQLFQKNKMDNLKNTPYKSRNRFYSAPPKGTDDLCSSEEELDDRIRSLYFRTRCGRNTFVEEKKLCTATKQLEETREKVIINEEYYNARKRGICQKFEHHAKIFQNQSNLEDMDLNKLKRAKQVCRARLKYIQEKAKSLSNEIKTLEGMLITITKKSKAAQKRLHELQKEQKDVQRTGRTAERRGIILSHHFCE
ncbi:hypothetical protein MKW94_025236 [Papaver nudicaule]|uniref:Uncharacterized protein n=1 Tax=Papaver nudicaule TaxID=74823 RepID=A0AA41VUW5_PAPNU|nr:hypothetical protein [Papaver nudicaule]